MDRTGPMTRPTVDELIQHHADFVFRTLARCGVKDADLRDGTQEVFIIAAQKLDQWEGQGAITSWLYGIAIRVASNIRKKAHRRHETFPDEMPEGIESRTPEGAALRNEARRTLERILDVLPEEQRVVFVLFELEEQTCPAISELLGIPLGTVYTRLRSARATFEHEVARAA